jgi:hypothetical protein
MAEPGLAETNVLLGETPAGGDSPIRVEDEAALVNQAAGVLSTLALSHEEKVVEADHESMEVDAAVDARPKEKKSDAEMMPPPQPPSALSGAKAAHAGEPVISDYDCSEVRIHPLLFNSVGGKPQRIGADVREDILKFLRSDEIALTPPEWLKTYPSMDRGLATCEFFRRAVFDCEMAYRDCLIALPIDFQYAPLNNKDVCGYTGMEIVEDRSWRASEDVVHYSTAAEYRTAADSLVKPLTYKLSHQAICDLMKSQVAANKEEAISLLLDEAVQNCPFRKILDPKNKKQKELLQAKLKADVEETAKRIKAKERELADLNKSLKHKRSMSETEESDSDAKGGKGKGRGKSTKRGRGRGSRKAKAARGSSPVQTSDDEGYEKPLSHKDKVKMARAEKIIPESELPEAGRSTRSKSKKPELRETSPPRSTRKAPSVVVCAESANEGEDDDEPTLEQLARALGVTTQSLGNRFKPIASAEDADVSTMEEPISDLSPESV